MTSDEIAEHLEHQITTNKTYFEKNAREGSRTFILNTFMLIEASFELGLLRWAQGDGCGAEARFKIGAGAYTSHGEAYRRLKHREDIRREFAPGLGSPERLARLAAYFVGESLREIHSEMPAPEEELGDEPWFEQVFTNACVDCVPIDAAKFATARQLYTRRRLPAFKLVEWDFYREVLEGGWRSRDPNEMLRHHESLYVKRAKKNGNFISGEGRYNTMVVDYMFAAILKRIGWRGQYRHAWPEDGNVSAIGSPPKTSTPPSLFLTPG